jgi:chromosome partitioning protein
MGASKYLSHISKQKGTVVDIFEPLSAPTKHQGWTTLLDPENVIISVDDWSWKYIHLIPSRLELAWALKNPQGKERLLSQFLERVSDRYDLIIIDCVPTESMLTTAAYLSSRYVFAPIKPEFLATIGLPLLIRSLEEHGKEYQEQELEMAGIIFNGGRTNPSPEQEKSYHEVKRLAKTRKWRILKNEVRYSDSYPTGSRKARPIFLTDYARDYVQSEFKKLGKEFLLAAGVKAIFPS